LLIRFAFHLRVKTDFNKRINNALIPVQKYFHHFPLNIEKAFLRLHIQSQLPMFLVAASSPENRPLHGLILPALFHPTPNTQHPTPNTQHTCFLLTCR